jgi:hypothetical protein
MSDRPLPQRHQPHPDRTPQVGEGVVDPWRHGRLDRPAYQAVSFQQPPRAATSVREAFGTGSSPTDFPAEHYERPWPDRFQPADLNSIGWGGPGLGGSIEA